MAGAPPRDRETWGRAKKCREDSGFRVGLPSSELLSWPSRIHRKLAIFWLYPWIFCSITDKFFSKSAVRWLPSKRSMVKPE